MSSDTIATRAHRVLERVREAEARAGRPAGSVRLCAVTKTFPPGAVDEAAAAGVGEVGENKVQEAAGKKPAVGAALRWHLIGHLQGNKARRAVELFDVIQTVDSAELAVRLDRIAGELGRRPDVFVQVDLGREATKTGVPEEELDGILDRLDGCEHLRPVGLMTVPPYFEDPEAVRPYFRRLSALRDRLAGRGGATGRLTELSMGMSHDFEVAIAEGATVVRVGSAIFGARG